MLPAAIRFAALLAGLWCGVIAGVGGLVAPALFARLPPAVAGLALNRVFEQEAYGSVAVGVVLLVVERARARRPEWQRPGSAFGADFGLALGVIACAVAGYFAVQPMMEGARAGKGALSFGALHAISASFFVLKGTLLAALAWRSTAGAAGREALRPKGATS